MLNSLGEVSTVQMAAFLHLLDTHPLSACSRSPVKDPVIGDVLPGQPPSPERPSKTYGKAMRVGYKLRSVSLS
ncbi:hypothetical protein ACLKA7_001438 [Drosophila subpalustris]